MIVKKEKYANMLHSTKSDLVKKGRDCGIKRTLYQKEKKKHKPVNPNSSTTYFNYHKPVFKVEQD